MNENIVRGTRNPASVEITSAASASAHSASGPDQKTGPARELVRYALALEASDFPPEVTAKVELCILDMLASSLMAGDLPWSRQAITWVRSLGAQPLASVIGTDLRTAPSEAAFANGVQAHGLIQESTHPASFSHIGVVILPVALAVGEVSHASGAEFAAAIVAGYEIMGRLGRVLVNSESSRYFRALGLIGPVAGAVAASRLLSLQEDAAVNALGLAGNLAIGLNEWPHAGGTEIFFHAGFAARNAVAAAMLAQLGTTASESILEGKAGMAAAYGGRERLDLLTRGLGKTFEILDVFYKPAPACAFVQTPCQAALQLVRERGIRPDAIDSVEVRVSGAALAYPGCNYAGPVTSIIQAKMSIQYGVAAVLVRGELSEENYRDLGDERIANLAQRITLAVDPEFSASIPSRVGAEVCVRLPDGSAQLARLDDLIALGPEAVRTRFRHAARKVIGDERAREIEATVGALRELRDIGTLTRLLLSPQVK